MSFSLLLNPSLQNTTSASLFQTSSQAAPRLLSPSPDQHHVRLCSVRHHVSVRTTPIRFANPRNWPFSSVCIWHFIVFVVAENRHFRQPHYLSTPPLQETLVNVCINLTLSETIESLGYIFVADSIGPSSFNFFFVVGSERRVKQCVMAIQGHPRSLILVPIESTYATSY